MRDLNAFKSKWVVIVLVFIVFALSLTGCQESKSTSKTPDQAAGEPAVTNGSPDAEMSSDQVQLAMGDGNLTFNVTINTAAEAVVGQAVDTETATLAGAVKTIRFVDAEPPQYLLAFTIADALGRLQLIPPEIRYAVKVEPGTPLVVNSAEFFKQLSHDGLVVPLKVQVVVVRAEDPFMRNPLSKPIDLTFSNDKTCEEGYVFDIGVDDESMTSLFEEGSLVIRVVGTEAQIDLGTYLNLVYQKPNVKIPFNYGRGISGGDFIIELTPEQMMSEGIEYGTMSIIDFNNRTISDSILLHFDANGSCIEGRFIEFTLKDPVQ